MEDDSDNPPGRRPHRPGVVPALSPFIDNIGLHCRQKGKARAIRNQGVRRAFVAFACKRVMHHQNKDWLFYQEASAWPGL